MSTITESADLASVQSPVHNAGDALTVLAARGLRLTKKWLADGTIATYDDAKFFDCSTVLVDDLRGLSDVLREMERRPSLAIVRGRFRGGQQRASDVGMTQQERSTAEAAGFVRKALHYFDDQPLHAVCLDIDKYVPLTCDAIDDPCEAILEFIYTQLPEAFHGAGYHWQLSSSAGHPSKKGLNAHLWFWLAEPLTSAQLKAWATAERVHVDKALFHPVQWHYTAAPVFEAGVADPIAVRSGLVAGHSVRLTVTEAVRKAIGQSAVALTKLRSMADCQDPYVEKLVELGCVVEEFGHGLGVRCINEPHRSGESGTSQAMYFPIGVGGRTEPGFKCWHQQCSGIVNASMFLRLVGADVPADDFDTVAVSEEEEAANAAVRTENARKAADRLPPLVLESDAERTRRVEREKSLAIGEGTTPLPIQGVMSGSEMLADLVFLSEGSRVSRVSDPRFVLSFADFKATTEASSTKVKSASGRTLKRSNAQLWLEHPERKTVRTQTFAPGRGSLCMSPDNVPAQNLWVPRTAVVPARWRELSAPFLEHVEYLVPAAAERERFLDWLAHIEQAPGVLPSTHYLLVASQTGIGRNWLAYALARAFPGHTALGFDLSASLKNGFNGALSTKLLAVVDELHEGGPGGAHTPAAEKLKSMLTEATRLINPKHGRQHTEFNRCRFLMFSNHVAALPLAENDRRVIVIENPGERRSEDYFRRLYALLDDPDFGPSLAEALRRRDIAGFNAGAPAPMTVAKARTIRAGRSEVEQAVRDVATEWPSACITSSRLQLAVGEALGGRTWNVQGASVAAGLRKFDGRVKVDRVAAHVWVLRDFDRWLGEVPLAVAAEVRRGQQASDIEDFA